MTRREKSKSQGTNLECGRRPRAPHALPGSAGGFAEASDLPLRRSASEASRTRVSAAVRPRKTRRGSLRSLAVAPSTRKPKTFQSLNSSSKTKRLKTLQ